MYSLLTNINLLAKYRQYEKRCQPEHMELTHHPTDRSRTVHEQISIQIYGSDKMARREEPQMQ